MTDLGPGWTRAKFGDVVKLNKARVADPAAEGIERYLGIEHIKPEDLRIRSWGLVADGTTFTNYFEPGQVLFVKRQAYQRKVAVADFAGVCSGDIYVLESKDPDVLLPELLPFLCQTESFFEHAVGTSAGSLSPRTNWTQLANYEFALPPLAEQRRIAEVLWAAEELSNKIENAMQACSSMMLAYIGDFLSKFDHDQFSSQIDALLSEPPKNGYSPRTNDSGTGIRTVSISSISDGNFIISGNIKYADVDLEKVSSFFVQRDDVFVVRGNGNQYLVGKCGIADRSFDQLFYPDLLIRLRFDTGVILPQFAVLQWNSPFVHRDLISRAKSTNGIWKVNGQDIRNHRLVVPPLDRQQSFLADYTRFVNASQSLDARSRSVANVKQSMLNSELGGSI